MTAPLKHTILKIDQVLPLTDFMQTVQQNYTLEKRLMRWADVNKKDTSGFTALYWAISHHHMTNLRILIDYGATLQVTSTENALFYAIDCDNLNALQYFLEKGIDKNITRTSNTGKIYTLLDHAKRLKRKVIIEYLI